MKLWMFSKSLKLKLKFCLVLPKNLPNPEQYSEEAQEWHVSIGSSHGHLIEPGSLSTGVRSILAYNADGHGTRVNYYSNPDVTYLPTGTPTGVRNISNNAAVITANRWVVTLMRP